MKKVLLWLLSIGIVGTAAVIAGFHEAVPLSVLRETQPICVYGKAASVTTAAGLVTIYTAFPASVPTWVQSQTYTNLPDMQVFVARITSNEVVLLVQTGAFALASTSVTNLFDYQIGY